MNETGAGRYVKAIASEARLIARVATASAFSHALLLVPPFVTAAIVDEIIPARDTSFLVLAALALVASYLAAAAVTFVRSLLLAHFTLMAEAALSTRLLTHLGTLPLSFFGTQSSGSLLTAVGCNSTARELVTSAALAILVEGPAVIIYATVLGISHTGIATGLIAVAGIRVVVLAITRPRQRRLTAAVVEYRSRLQASLVELMAGIETLKAMGLEGRLVREWLDILNAALSASLTKSRQDALVGAVMFLLGATATTLVTVWGAALVISGDLSLGMMLAVAALSSGFVSATSNLASAAIQVQALDAYTSRVDGVMAAAAEPTGGNPIDAFGGQVELLDVSFTYGSSPVPALSGVSLAIEARSRVAIVGKTGSGKSTLARIIAGLQTPSAGEVRFDGRRSSDVEPRSLRRQIGLVSQETHLFGRSIRDNVSLADPDLPMSSIVRACRTACIHDDINAMQGGYDTVLSDRGASLSGGQRQRLAIARAVAHVPSLLILDEATSQLDQATERAIIANLAELGCTVVAVTHRLSTIVNYDTVVVVAEGTIRDVGAASDVTTGEALRALM